MVRGVVQDWALVEFFESEDTEATQVKLNGRCIRGQPIRIQYCIPGVQAMKLHVEVIIAALCLTESWLTNRILILLNFKAMNAPVNAKKKALINDTPSANVYGQLQKLGHQNPACESINHRKRYRSD